MTLLVTRARFAEAPPSVEVFRRELLNELGDVSGLESYNVQGNQVEVFTMLDPVTEPYAVKVLLRFGGECLDWQTFEPRDPRLPAFVSRRWREWPWWTRAGIRLRFLLGILATALPRGR